MEVDGRASPILGMDFFIQSGIVLDFNNTVIWSKEMVTRVQITEELAGTRLEAVQGVSLPPRCEKVFIRKVPNLPPGATFLVEGCIDELMSGYGAANTLTRVDENGKCAVSVMNPHAKTISIQKGSRIGVTSIPTGIESPYPVSGGSRVGWRYMQ